MKLLLRPKPEEGESFIGYIVRLTELNGYDTPSWILSLSDIDYMELQWNFTFMFSQAERLKKFAEITDNKLRNLFPVLYLPDESSARFGIEGEYNFYGAFLNRSIIRPHCPKVCPKCLKESGYARRVWDCSLVTACPIHACMLIDTCPKCRRRIKCVRRSLSVCSCRYDWKEIDPEFLTARELAVSRLVHTLCGLQAGALQKEKDNPLHRLNLRDFVVVLTLIAGTFRNIASATGRPSKSIKLRNKDLHALYGQAYSVFGNWPHNFHQFLSKQSKGQVRFHPHDGKLNTSLKTEFGSFYEHLYQVLNEPQFDFMREAFVQYLTDRLHSQGQPAKGISFATTIALGEHISLYDARRLLKITNKALFDLITDGEIRCVIKNARRNPEYTLNLLDIEGLKREFEQSITPRELANQLGIDCKTIRKLAQNKLLKTRWRSAIDGLHTMKFSRDASEEFQRKTGQ